MIVIRVYMYMLSKDGIRFEVFLNGTNRKAGEAIKRADEETKKKQEKNHEIKRLTQQIQAVNSEMSKHRCALLMICWTIPYDRG